jgi:hypothetical protein
MRVFVFLALITVVFCRVYNIRLSFYKGQATLLSTFGHTSNGVFKITMNNFVFHGLKPEYRESEMLKQVGFIYKPVQSDNTADWETAPRGDECFTTHLKQPYYQFTYNLSTTYTQSISQPSLYGLFFYHCEKILHLPISFEISIEEYNIISGSKHYLSVGEIPMILIYLCLALLFGGLGILWAVTLWRQRENTFRIHYLMGVLVVLKTLSLFFEGVRFIDLDIYGYSVMWSILYYIFTILKAFMLFVVILLIGSGWSFIKPYLNDFEKQLLLVILTLQVVSNVSMVIIEQTAEGASSWLYWKSILLWVDVICCCLVLPAIAWSIRNLRNAKDEKSIKNAVRLSQFQQFYLVVIGYLYFTRIIALFIKDSLPHTWSWVPDLAAQLVSMGLFVFTGYRFRPMKDNPYTSVKSESDDEDVVIGHPDEIDKDFQLGDETHDYKQESDEDKSKH